MRILAAIFISLTLAPFAVAAPADDIADVLVQDVRKPTITPDTLSADFARLTRFVRHDASGMVLFTDGGSTDGYVRHAMANFYSPAPAKASKDAKTADATNMPLFLVAFEFSDQPDFSFDGLAAALAQRLGAPSSRSDQSGATFRTWSFQQPAGRSLTLARAQASDNGDPIAVVRIMQNR
jgi:hypothetical protein